MITAILGPRFAACDLATLHQLFPGTGVSWGPYRSFSGPVEFDPRWSESNPMWSITDASRRRQLPDARDPLDFSAIPRQPVRRAPLLDEPTEQVLVELLGMTQSEVGLLEAEGRRMRRVGAAGLRR